MLARSFCQELVDGASRALAVGDRLDEVSGPEGHVAAGEDSGGRRGQGVRIHPDRAPPGQRDAVGGLQERQIRRLADGQDARVGFEGDHVLVVVGRCEAAFGIEDRDDAAQLDGGEPAASDEALRAPPRKEGDTLAPRLVELLAPLGAPERRHLVEALEGDDRHLRGSGAERGAGGVEGFLGAGVVFGGEGLQAGLVVPAEPQRGARGVERHEASADDDDVPAQIDAVALVDVEEVVHRLDHAVQLHARHVQLAPFRHADRKEDRLEALLPQLAEAEGRRQGRSKLQGDAEREDLVDLGPDEGAGEPILRYPEAHHPSGLRR